jgi:1-acyl-sn-glycerol-3-phosphate acyltransferase
MPEIKPQVYKDDRPAEYFDQFHAAARKGVGWTYTFVRLLVTLPTLVLWRVRAIGVGKVPKSGPLILAPNHFSQMDHFFTGLYLRRKIRFMAKSQLFGPPVLTYVYKHGGVFPVRRGHHDEEAFKTARAILDQGGMLLVYAEGGRAETGDRQDRTGIGGAGGAGRHPRLGHRSRLEALPISQGDRGIRRAAQLPGREGPGPRPPARGRRGDLRQGAADVRRAGARAGAPPRD